MKKKITLIILVVIAVFSISLGVTITTLDSDNKKEETKNKEENKIKTYEIMLKTTYYKEGTEIKYRKTKKMELIYMTDIKMEKLLNHMKCQVMEKR